MKIKLQHFLFIFVLVSIMFVTNKQEVNGITVLSLDEILDKTDYLVLTVGHKEFIENKDKIFSKKVYNCIGL